MVMEVESLDHKPANSPQKADPDGDRPDPTANLHGMASPRHPKSLSRILLNLALLFTLSGLLSSWLIFYTDWFPVVVKLLGIGGGLAFVASLISKDTRETLRTVFETQVLGGKWTRAVLLALFLPSLLLLTMITATVVLRSVGDGSERQVHVFQKHNSGSDQRKLIHESTLSPGSTKKILLIRNFRSPHARVKLSGLPSSRVRLPLVRRATLTSPTSFLDRPVVLIRPTSFLSEIADDVHLLLLVKRRGEVLARFDPYDGRAVWIGCDEEVAVPALLRDRWRLELSMQGYPDLAYSMWMPPQAPENEIDLEANDKLEILLVHPDGTPYADPITETIHRDLQPTNFPQEIVLDGPN